MSKPRCFAPAIIISDQWTPGDASPSYRSCNASAKPYGPRTIGQRTTSSTKPTSPSAPTSYHSPTARQTKTTISICPSELSISLSTRPAWIHPACGPAPLFHQILWKPRPNPVLARFFRHWAECVPVPTTLAVRTHRRGCSCLPASVTSSHRPG